ncbi:MAG: 3-deoxy-manno-octulosonate cytidylyltransferase [Bacteroides sp.]|nr:3-deoxy-manno-octulosonate cytidylyltransferase [Bacteroides sp.]
MKFIGIIPARYASTRFPGKPLADICGKTMIERVYLQVKKALDEVWVATDDNRIYDTVKSFGGNVVMTSEAHRSGTDRCYEAYLNIGSDADVVINIQGDEPFIDPSQIEEIKKCFDDKATQIATLARPFDPELGIDALFNPNTPKLVFDENMFAMYFSRSVIPYLRGVDKEDWAKKAQYYTHIGMYAYRADILKQITCLPQSPLELIESLEQLRWLQNGYKIKVGTSSCGTIGIDTPEDLEQACRLLSSGKI